MNLPDFIGYSDFKIKVRVNFHTECYVSFCIHNNEAEAFLAAAENRKKVEIYSNSGDYIMSGIVAAVTVSYGVTSVAAAVTIMSESILFSESSAERIFQDPDKTYMNILETYPQLEIGKCVRLKDCEKNIVCQHNTDNFSFLLYLSRKCGTGLWITDEGKISFGNPNIKKRISDSEKSYRKSILEKKIKSSKYGREINILTMEQFPNGALLEYDNTDYVICETDIFEECDETYFRYTGYTNPDFASDVIEEDKQILTAAKVTDNKDPNNLGRIQLTFSEFSDKSSKKTWIPYLTPFVGKYHDGLVMIPDIGDTVIVCISNGAAYAIGSLRTEALPESCRSVEKKYFSVKSSFISVDEKEIKSKQSDKISGTMKSDSLMFEYDDTRITLSDKTVIMGLDSSKITINSDSVNSEVGKSSVKIKSDEINAEIGDGKLNVKNGNILIKGGKAQLSLNNGKTKLSGNTIDLSTQGFSS